jgi:hypothetical protein
VPRPLAGTYSTVAIPRPPTTIWVPSGNCALVAYHRPFCKGTSVSTQLQSPSPPHGAKVLICRDATPSTNWQMSPLRMSEELLFLEDQFMGLQLFTDGLLKDSIIQVQSKNFKARISNCKFSCLSCRDF